MKWFMVFSIMMTALLLGCAKETKVEAQITPGGGAAGDKLVIGKNEAKYATAPASSAEAQVLKYKSDSNQTLILNQLLTLSQKCTVTEKDLLLVWIQSNADKSTGPSTMVRVGQELEVVGGVEYGLVVSPQVSAECYPLQIQFDLGVKK